MDQSATCHLLPRNSLQLGSTRHSECSGVLNLRGLPISSWQHALALLLALRYPGQVVTSLNPTEGVRLLLEVDEVADDGESAQYLASIHTVNESFAYKVELHMDGTAKLTAVAESASAVDEQNLNKLAKSTARAAKRKLAENLPAWPPRVLRWRGPGRG